MGTKNNPGEFDCYANAEPDEPMFVLLARDPLAPDLVDRWAIERCAARGLDAKVSEARKCAEAMRAWMAAKVVAVREDHLAAGRSALPSPEEE